MHWNLQQIAMDEISESDWEDSCAFWIRLELQQLANISPPPSEVRYSADVLNPEEYDDYWILWEQPEPVDAGGNWNEGP